MPKKWELKSIHIIEWMDLIKERLMNVRQQKGFSSSPHARLQHTFEDINRYKMCSPCVLCYFCIYMRLFTMKLQLLIICSLLDLGSAWNQPSTCYMHAWDSFLPALQIMKKRLNSWQKIWTAMHSQQIQMLEAQLVNSNRQSEMKITELQAQLNTSFQILQGD